MTSPEDGLKARDVVRILNMSVGAFCLVMLVGHSHVTRLRNGWYARSYTSSPTWVANLAAIGIVLTICADAAIRRYWIPDDASFARSSPVGPAPVGVDTRRALLHPPADASVGVPMKRVLWVELFASVMVWIVAYDPPGGRPWIGVLLAAPSAVALARSVLLVRVDISAGVITVHNFASRRSVDYRNVTGIRPGFKDSGYIAIVPGSASGRTWFWWMRDRITVPVAIPLVDVELALHTPARPPVSTTP